MGDPAVHTSRVVSPFSLMDSLKHLSGCCKLSLTLLTKSDCLRPA